MLDFDLAKIYGYTTKAFNQQVKNNHVRFDADFTFKLTRDEWKNLKSGIAPVDWGGSRYLPNAFTEQGIYMLMTILKGELATRQSKALIRTFKKMKDYILGNQSLIGQREIMQLSLQTSANTTEIGRIRMDLGSVEKQMSDVMDLLGDASYHHDGTERISLIYAVFRI